MAISQRVPVPPELAAATDLRAMCAAADKLKQLDTPQALPALGQLHQRAPGRLGLLLGFPLRTLLLALIALIALALVGIGWLAAFWAYSRLLAPIAVREGGWLYAWVGLALGTALWLIAFNPTVRRLFVLPGGRGDVKLAWFWRGLLWLAAQTARAAMLAALLLGIAGLLLPACYGLCETWRVLANFPPVALGPIEPLQRYLGLDPFITIGPTALLIAAGLLAAVLARWARRILLGGFWLLGAWLIYNLGGFASEELAALAVLALLWPLRIAQAFARFFGWPYRTWRGRIAQLVLGWDLRDSLAAAFAEHRRRNRTRVRRAGANAVCRNDLAFFVPEQAGPVAFWWCPDCHDDDAAYLGVKTVRGVLDTGFTEKYEQAGATLRINLRAWQSAAAPLPCPPLQEVAIGPLADPHEVEMFITQYLNVQAERKWPSLAKVTAVIAPEANLDENGRRQVQRNLRAA